MDLLALFQKSLRNPFSLQSVFIIFVNLFIFITVGLVLVVIFLLNSSQDTLCDKPGSAVINGTVTSKDETAYTFSFRGNDKCMLSTRISWQNSSEPIDIWLYDPQGNVSILEGNKESKTNSYLLSAPTKGDWRLALKTNSAVSIPFTGEINFK